MPDEAAPLMRKYRHKRNPDVVVEAMRIDKPSDHPAIIVDPEGFKAPYIMSPTNLGDRPHVVYKGCFLVVRHDARPYVVSPTDFEFYYETGDPETKAPPTAQPLSAHEILKTQHRFPIGATVWVVPTDVDTHRVIGCPTPGIVRRLLFDFAGEPSMPWYAVNTEGKCSPPSGAIVSFRCFKYFHASSLYATEEEASVVYVRAVRSQTAAAGSKG